MGLVMVGDIDFEWEDDAMDVMDLGGAVSAMEEEVGNGWNEKGALGVG